jgi:hypothetical protein
VRIGCGRWRHLPYSAASKPPPRPSRLNGSNCPEADPRSGAARSRDEGRSKLLAAELRADLAQFEGRIDNRLTGIDGRISSIESRLANLASAAQLL